MTNEALKTGIAPQNEIDESKKITIHVFKNIFENIAELVNANCDGEANTLRDSLIALLEKSFKHNPTHTVEFKYEEGMNSPLLIAEYTDNTKRQDIPYSRLILFGMLSNDSYEQILEMGSPLTRKIVEIGSPYDYAKEIDNNITNAIIELNN